MRLVIRIVLFIAMMTAIIHSAASAVDYDLGEVIEKSPDSNYIQVKDKIYKVSTVEILTEEGPALPGSLRDLSEGSIVKVVRGKKHIDYWEAALVTVYQGEMEKKMREELELPAKRAESKQKVEPVSDSSIKREGGVWKN